MGGVSVSGQGACSSAAGCKGRFVLCLFLLLFFSGCGEEGGSPPVLTDYQVPWPPRFVVGFPEPVIIGDVSFQDPDGDVVLLTISWQECGNGPVKKLDVVQEDVMRTKIGEMPFTVVVSTDCSIGTYTVDLMATDGRGYTSNVLSVPYEIYQ